MNILDLTKNLSLKEMGEYLLAEEILQRSSGTPVPEHYAVRYFGIKDAINLAAFLHRDQRRQNRGNLPKDTYITHPLRNTLRLMRYGVTERDILIASVLHDTVEDCAEGIIEWGTGFSAEGGPISLREQALFSIRQNFGNEVGRLVAVVSNLPLDPEAALTKQQKRDIYYTHVKDVVLPDDMASLIKFSDFVDNALGLHHNTANTAMQKSLALKYLPLVELFEEVLTRPGVRALMSEEGWKKATIQLAEGSVKLEGLTHD